MYYFWSVLFLISISSVKKWKSLNDIMEKQDKNGLCKTYGTKYSKVDQVNFMEDSLLKIWRDMVWKAVLLKIYLNHSWILYPVYCGAFFENN